MTYPVRPVKASIVLDADPDEVFAFLADTRNDPEWCPNVSDVRQLKGDGVGVGARFAFHQVIEARGRQMESDVDVEVLGLGERSIEWRIEDRFQVRNVQIEVEGEDGRSRVSQVTRAEFKRKPGLARWLYPVLAKRTFADQFSRLADVVEDR